MPPARITGMHCRVLSDAGAYAGFGGALAIGPTRMMAQGVYRIPSIRYDVAVAVTNTTPMGAFRGAGRPEAAEFLERMMDIAAARMGIDPLELRRRNLMPAFVEPVRTVMGTTYDTGDYQKALDEAVRLAGYDEVRAEQARRRAAGDRWQIGVGVSVYVEITAGGGSQEFGSVEVHRDGTATIRVGTSAHGQGHATAFAMIVSDRLGIPIDDIRFVQSDTAAVPRGGGTGGSRSLQIGGSAVLSATDEVLARAKELAAAHLEASVDDMVVHADGRVGVVGVPARALSWADLAGLAAEAAAGDGSAAFATPAAGPGGPPAAGNGAASGPAPDALGPLAAAVDFSQEGATFPFGAHVSIVDVDMETGEVRPYVMWRSMTADGSSTRCWYRASSTAGSPRGWPRRCGRRWCSIRRQSADLEPGRLRHAQRGRVPVLRDRQHRDPHAPEPARGQGHRRVGDHRLHTVGAQRGCRRPLAPGVRHVDMPCTPQRVWRAIVAAAPGRIGWPARPLWRDPPAVFDDLARAGSDRATRGRRRRHLTGAAQPRARATTGSGRSSRRSGAGPGCPVALERYPG